MNIYRNSGAMQFSVIEPTFKTNDKGHRFVEKTGAIMINAAIGKDRQYNWDNKVTFALSVNDLPFMYDGFDNLNKTGDIKISIIHDPNAGTSDAGGLIKTFDISKGSIIKDKQTYMISITYAENKKQVNKAYVAVAKSELLILEQLIKSLTSKLYGF